MVKKQTKATPRVAAKAPPPEDPLVAFAKKTRSKAANDSAVTPVHRSGSKASDLVPGQLEVMAVEELTGEEQLINLGRE